MTPVWISKEFLRQRFFEPTIELNLIDRLLWFTICENSKTANETTETYIISIPLLLEWIWSTGYLSGEFWNNMVYKQEKVELMLFV